MGGITPTRPALCVSSPHAFALAHGDHGHPYPPVVTRPALRQQGRHSALSAVAPHRLSGAATLAVASLSRNAARTVHDVRNGVSTPLRC
jgi:hypothetical protein